MTKYYIRHDNNLDGPFNGRAEAEAHVRRCEYVAHNVKFEYITETALAKEMGLVDGDSDEEE